MWSTNSNIIDEISKFAAVEAHAGNGLQALEEKLAIYVNGLINSNFDQLVQLLYRVDVSESKLKQLLKAQPAEDAGLIIAKLIIERQLQKIKSRQEFKQDTSDEDGEEKW